MFKTRNPDRTRLEHWILGHLDLFRISDFEFFLASYSLAHFAPMALSPPSLLSPATGEMQGYKPVA